METRPTIGARANLDPIHSHPEISGYIENLTEIAKSCGPGFASPYELSALYTLFFDQMCRALHFSTPRHVLLVRERGVGDHAALVELARHAVIGHPPFLQEAEFYLLDCRLISQDRIQPVLEQLFFQREQSSEAIFCISNFSILVRPGVSSFDFRSVIHAALSFTRSRIVAIVTPRELEELISCDPELEDLFTVVNLPEPDIDTAVSLVRHFATGLERQYRLRIDDSAVDRAVSLSDCYMLHDRLPYKAIKILRSICEDLNYERARGADDAATILGTHALHKVSQMTGIPEVTLAGVGEEVDYFHDLSKLIVGQEHALREVSTELGLIKAGMVDSGKPASVMMFIGQTGTGKTELAKAIAKYYSASRKLKTFTLGNFSEPHSVAGIIGVPPGYVGHERGGRLVNELNSDPYGVFLLDEADKAHPDVMQPFLNLFDEGWLTDQRGVKAFAHRAIFILTTNIGQRQISDMCRSGKSIEEITSAMKDSLGRIRHTKSNRPVFTPEFLSRIKRIIVFRSLDEQSMEGICRRLASDLRNDWAVKRKKNLIIPEALLCCIARKAFAIDSRAQGREGGRIVRKLLANIVESEIQKAIRLSPDKYQACSEVVIRFDEVPGSETTEFDMANVSAEFQPPGAS